MAQQNSTPTLPNVNSATSVSPLELESSPKNDIWKSKSVNGFRVAVGSEITPRELALAGFEMKNFEFFPQRIEEVKALIHTAYFETKVLRDNFTVTNVSASEQPVYLFLRVPF